jgi:hypothetical protein
LVQELPYAFVDTAPKIEGPPAGNDSLPVVLPVTENLLPPFAPTSDQSWLTIDGITNGIVSFSFTATPTNRTGHIALLGQSIPVLQGVIYEIATNALSEGSVGGSDSVQLTVTLPSLTWTNTANASWLHLSPADQSGAGSTNIVFAFDDNPGGTRSGTLTIAGLTVTVTQGPAFYTLSTNVLQEGINAGTDSVGLTATPGEASWTNTANATWLHLSPANQSGTGSTNVIFTFDANPGRMRIGTLTIAGLTVTVTQSGSPYVLGTATRLEGPASGIDSVILVVTPQMLPGRTARMPPGCI